MSEQQEQLLIAIGVRQNQIEREMRKISQSVGGNLDKVERRARQTGARMEQTFAQASSRIVGRLKGIGTAFVGGLVAGGVTGVVSQLGRVAAGVAAIGDESKRAGVSSRVFQEWKAVAEQARIPVDALVDGLKELSLRGDEFAITGKGSAAEAFQRLGYDAAELKKKLADPSALLLEIIDRLGRFDKAAQIRISDELFGGSAGERFVELLDQGAAGIRATINEAHRLGNVLSDDVITRAAEVDRQFTIISQTVGTTLRGAIVDAVGALQSFIDSFRAFENQQGASLNAELATIGRQRLDLENQILRLRNEQRDAFAGNPFGRDYEGDIAYLEAERAALGETEAQILAVIEARRLAAQPPAGNGPAFTPPAYVPPPPANGGNRDDAAAKAAREAEAVRRLIAELEHELTLIGATDLQRQISNTLRQAGAAATDDERAKIVALVTALAAEEAAQQKATEAKREFANMATGAISGFAADLMNGVSAGDAFGNMIKRLAAQLVDLAIQMMIIRPLMGMFGFSGGGYVSARATPGYASGGYVRGPGTSTSDSIPARLSDGEFVINARATARHRQLLEAINSGTVSSYASGGMVGASTPVFASAGAAPSIVVAPSITVEGGSRGPEADMELARTIGKQVETIGRAVVMEELRRAQRPGNIGNSRAMM